MFEQSFVYHCCTVMAGIKTASLFSFKFTDLVFLKNEICRLNSICIPKGLKIVILNIEKNRALIYAYRVLMLNQDFKNPLAYSLLSQRDYNIDKPEICIKQLSYKIQNHIDFPHEIGLFLGYPPEDVYGFICNKQCAKCTGMWKVYENEDQARKKFKQFQKCKKAYCKYYSKFNSIDRLIVAV